MVDGTDDALKWQPLEVYRHLFGNHGSMHHRKYRIKMVVAETSAGSPRCGGDRINLSLPVSSDTLGTGVNITPLSGRMNADSSRTSVRLSA